MSNPLLEDISPEKRELLAGLASHPGFGVLVELFEAACGRANKRLIQLKPSDLNYKRLVEEYHLQSHVVNEFCSDVLKSIGFHAQYVAQTRLLNEDDVRRLVKDIEEQPQIPKGNPLGRKPDSGE